MLKNFVEPEFKKKGFTCFKCGAFSNHDWDETRVNYTQATFHSYRQGDDLRKISLCRCQQCNFISYWIEEQLIWPQKMDV